jgi:hypothetical protein
MPNRRSGHADVARTQVRQLLGWAAPLGDRTWANESAGGLGYLLAQQLVAAGETVLDVPATLASRIRVSGSGAWRGQTTVSATSMLPRVAFE